jgi:voltage-gated potassium channel
MPASVSGLRARLFWPLLLLVLVVGYGTAGYMVIGGWSLIDAVYMTLTTLTTVGFREVRPLGTGGRIFTMSVIVFGVSALLITMTVLAGWVAEGALGERNWRRKMQRRVAKLSEHFIICAYGRVGRAVARVFEEQGQEFVVIESREDLEEVMIQDAVAYVIGDPTLEHTLRAAGLEDAKGLVCAVDSDATNVYIALIARSANPDIFIVARASEPDSTERLSKAGADRVISPYVTSGRHMAQLALRPRVVDYLDVETRDSHPLRLEEVRVEEASQLVDHTIEEICGSAIPLAVRHAGGDIESHPVGDLRLKAGDLLLLMGDEEGLRPVEGR